MAWPARHVAPGDAVVAVARRHWAGLALPLAAATVVLAAAVVVAVDGAPRPLALALGGVLILTLVWLVACYLRWRLAPAAITSTVLLVRRGVRRPHVVALDEVRDVRLRRRRLQRLVRSADLLVEEVDGSVTVLEGVGGAPELRRLLWRQVDRRRAQAARGARQAMARSAR